MVLVSTTHGVRPRVRNVSIIGNWPASVDNLWLLMGLSASFPGLSVRRVHNDYEFAVARRMHAACYLAADYVGPEQINALGMIDDDWVRYSDYYIAVDTDTDEIVGTARIIQPSIRGFPAAEHTPLYSDAIDIFAALDPNLCMEISALATPRKGLQNTVVSTALYAKLATQAVLEHRAYVLAIMDQRLLRIMNTMLLLPFEPIGDAKPERSQSTLPAAVYVPRVMALLREQQPDTLQMFTGGMPFSQLDEIELDLRDRAPEHRPTVVDLRSRQDQDRTIA